ncbi:MAG: hypothetical protein HZA50_04430 [Planctomycetes bacterium]|nr:hypothetical protein [Planctomycetota bacterium]
METVTISPQIQGLPVIACRPLRLVADGVRRSDLVVLELEMSRGPVFGQAKVTAAGRSDAIFLPDQIAAQLPAIGSAVEITPPDGQAGFVFRGVATRHELPLTGGPEIPLAIVEHELAVQLRGPAAPRWELSAGSPARNDQGRIAFNDSQQNLAGAARYNLNGRNVRVFDSSPDAVWWTAGEALNYLIASVAPAGLFIQSAAEIESLCGRARLEPIRLAEMNAGEVLAGLAAAAGLAMRAAGDGRGAIFYRPGIDARRVQARLQPAGASLDPRLGKIRQGSLKKSKRSARPRIIALGDFKRYQATFQLQPGWDASLQTTRWRDFVRSDSTGWQAVADVFRRWVLNEHGRYAEGPWNLPIHDFAPISAEDFFLTVPRRFLPCLSCDSSGQSLGVAVEWRAGTDEQWRRWPGAISLPEAECAIRLDDDWLPADFFQAALDGLAEFRVTASVDSDARLKVEIPGDPALPCRVMDFSSRAKWQKVHASSVIPAGAAASGSLERDDLALLQNAASARGQQESASVRVELTLGWVDASYQIGDIIERLDGVGIELAGSSAARPAITHIRHELDGRWQTTIGLGD